MNLVSRSVFPCALLLVACGGSKSESDGAAATETEDPCHLESGFEGDDLCIPPPAAGEGIQLHVGPASYDDPEALAPYLLDPGGEDVKCYQTLVPEGGFHYLRHQNRMRSGSHHMLIPLRSADGQSEGPSACDAFGSLGAIPGSQTPARDFPGELGPEDEGLARWLPENAMASFQLHYVNNGEEPVLREAWINIFKKDESEVTQALQSVFIVGDISVDVKPQTRATTHVSFTPNLTEPVRIFQMNGHSHAHAESFTAWRVRNGEKELIYQSFDWAEPINLTMNSVVKNPMPDATARTDGGISGLFHMEPGDSFEWECVVNNTTDADLRFANEAYTAEMCLLAGAYIGDDGTLFRGVCTSNGCLNGFAPANTQ